MSNYNHFKKLPERNKPARIEDYLAELRGPAQNKHGGHKMQRIRGLRGNTYGPASPVRQFTMDEIADYERQAREDGKL